MKVLNEYPNSHYYWEDYRKTDCFCPLCGQKEVWTNHGPGDYYLGRDSLCASCNAILHLDNCDDAPNSPNVQGILKQLREGVTAEPTTKPGR